MKPKISLLLLCIGFALCANANNGEEATKKTDILGGVYRQDSRQPLRSVSVTVYSDAKKEKVVLTNAAGLYAFDDLKAGTYKFVFEKYGYKKVTCENVLVRPDEGVQLNIEMSEHAALELLPGPVHFFEL